MMQHLKVINLHISVRQLPCRFLLKRVPERMLVFWVYP